MSKVTADMIDDELVEKIWDEGATLTRNDIRKVLAWLANNPVPATWSDIERIEQAELSEEDRQMGNSLTPVRAATAWQRIAYLKKEEPLPEELKNMIRTMDTTIYAEKFKNCVIEAYKIGLSRK